MSKVLVIEEALDIGQTERMRNQRILYAGHTAAPLRKGGQYRDLVHSLVCLQISLALHGARCTAPPAQGFKTDPRLTYLEKNPNF